MSLSKGEFAIRPSLDISMLKVSFTDPYASLRLSTRLGEYLRQLRGGRRIAVVCLGTDRSTGDALGPLAGTTLLKYHSSLFDLYGTLEEPVHALNLDATLNKLHDAAANPFIIGIDACLGKVSSVGCVLLGEGPILPGAGVNKKLPPVGDIHMSGVVNVGGFLDHYVLQSTRLHVVMSMSELIARSLYHAIAVSVKEASE
ncbi:spore protease YyaC [Cohnella lubricantis]|uniref:Spore protease YyaC n=1 Tax=Cohnella lubricantis TaxID=2163172 RepID=A0A841TC28_9BACL|nr:spore protease YyaC [Cohnella lubricantis]MBB6676928.1 spore protease YyaC [Cohnella lubricantis]MBP2118332.1 putative sporulation protein YyaC [Cohnella lubricantis]